MTPVITLGSTLYVPLSTRPLLHLHLKGKFPKGTRVQAQALSKSIRVRVDTDLVVLLGAKDGYNRKRKQVILSSASLSPPKLNTLLPQLIGLHFWFHILDAKGRLAYTNTIKDLPGAQEPLKDFAFSFGRFWDGSLKQPRKKLLHLLLVKVKGPFEPPDLPSEMNMRNPKPERRMPIPAPPGYPNPDSQFH